MFAHPLRQVLVISGGLFTLLICIAAPLFTYMVSLAFFGLPHVLSELRYVSYRFSPHFPQKWIISTGVGLATIVLTRVASWFHFLSTDMGRVIELCIVGYLMIIAILWLGKEKWWLSGLLALFAYCISVDPLTTSIAFAVLHNFTPIGFLSEALQGKEKRWAMLGSVFVFVVIPLLILSGIPTNFLQNMQLLHLEYTPFQNVYLASFFKVYVPPLWQEFPEFALLLFTSCVWAQCVHYAVVIHLLPRLKTSESELSLHSQKGKKRWLLILVFIGLISGLSFMYDFGTSQRIYGLFAAVHAWVEVPLLLAVLLSPRVAQTDF